MEPLYQQIEQSIKEIIAGFDYEPGDKIPSERELSEQLNVSRMTLRRAIESLIAQGFLERRSTSGTFVKSPNLLRPLSPTFVQSLSRQVAGIGETAGSKLLLFENLRAPRNISQYLNVRLGSQLFMIKRLRLINDTPFCIETSYLPCDLFPGLTANDILELKSLYEFLEKNYSITPVRSEDRLKIAFATKEEAGLLLISEGDAILYFRSLVFNSMNRAFEFVKSINHPEKVAFESISNKNIST